MGRNPEFPNDRFSQAHEALGSFNGEAERTGCTIEAKGRAIVRRESAVASTSVQLP